MNNLLKFANKALSKAEMASVKGGKEWCYAYDCTCGNVSYNSWGNLSQYSADGYENCIAGPGGNQGPVSCTFTELPEGSCGVS